MATVPFGDRSRLIIKNIPNSLDNKALDKLISKKCKILGVTKCDIRLLMKEKKVNRETKRVSRGICYVGFISEKDATKFLNHYNNTYFNACKVEIEYSRPPGQVEKAPEKPKAATILESKSEGGKHVVKKEVTPRKAGVAAKQVHITFDSDSEDAHEPESDPSEGALESGLEAKGTHPDRIANIRESDPLHTEASDRETLLDMNRVVIFNLPYSVTEDMVRNLVKPYGKVEQIHIPLNKYNYNDPSKIAPNMTKGMCFVTFAFESDAHRFIQEKNKSIFAGRIVNVALATAQNTDSDSHPNGVTKYYNKRRNESTFSDFKMKKRLQQSANPDIWNVLHIDIHAAVTSITAELGLESDEVLRDEEAGVNAALSESYVLNRIKKWMAEQGINYDVTDYKEEDLHEDLLLIKNLPHNAEDGELISLFSNCGHIIRFTTSPFKLLGLVQFSNKFECDKAFRTLSYKMYRAMPLYLQKVSKHLLPDSDKINSTESLAKLKETQSQDIANVNGTKLDSEKAQEPQHQVDEPTHEEGSDGEEADERVGHVSVYVSNIDPSVDEQEIDKRFSDLKGFIISKIIRPVSNGDKETGAKTDRTRYGFIEFDSLHNAREAIKKRCGTLIAGRVINMELSKNKQTISKFSKKREDGPAEENDVIIVKNLPFQATKKELMDLFKYYANVKTVRIPKSAANTHRGFGFVEFLSKGDAKVAMENLKNVHLYGRRLVLQYVENSK